MPLKTRQFSAALYPAFRCKHGGGIMTRMTIGLTRESEDNGARATFEASTTAEVISAVQRLAQTYGKACHASVQVVEGRKPTGFDAATEGLYFNLDRAEVA